MESCSFNSLQYNEFLEGAKSFNIHCPASSINCTLCDMFDKNIGAHSVGRVCYCFKSYLFIMIMNAKFEFSITSDTQQSRWMNP